MVCPTPFMWCAHLSSCFFLPLAGFLGFLWFLFVTIFCQFFCGGLLIASFSRSALGLPSQFDPRGVYHFWLAASNLPTPPACTAGLPTGICERERAPTTSSSVSSGCTPSTCTATPSSRSSSTPPSSSISCCLSSSDPGSSTRSASDGSRSTRLHNGDAFVSSAPGKQPLLRGVYSLLLRDVSRVQWSVASTACKQREKALHEKGGVLRHARGRESKLPRARLFHPSSPFGHSDCVQLCPSSRTRSTSLLLLSLSFSSCSFSLSSLRLIGRVLCCPFRTAHEQTMRAVHATHFV